MTKPHFKIAADGTVTPQLQMVSNDSADVVDPHFANWLPVVGSPDEDLNESEMHVMVPRSRDLVRNNGLASGYVQTTKDNILGHILKLQAKPMRELLGWSVDQANDWANKTEAEFSTYADTTECDASRELNLIGLTAQALGALAFNGEALCVPKWLPDPNTRWSARLQMIETDRLKTPTHLKNNSNIRNGKEYNKNGVVVAYYILKSFPGDHSLWGVDNADPNDYKRIPAFTSWGRRRVIHLFDAERTGQSRGKSVLSSVMKEFKQAGRYTQEELKGTIVNALTAGFIESNLDQQSLMDMFSTNPNTTPGDLNKQWMSQFSESRVQLKGGAMIPLPLGAKVTSFNPGRPNQAFEAFMKAVLMHISAGLNVPYELLTKDFSNTNYSSARAALLEAWKYFLGKRRFLVDNWLRPVYELWMEEAIDLQRIKAPDYYANKYAYLRCKFIFAGRGWVDPLKEIKAAGERMALGITNLEIECADQGQDYVEVLEGQVRVLEKKKELGLSTATEAETETAATQDAATVGDSDDLDEEEEEEEEDTQNAQARTPIEDLDLSLGAYRALSAEISTYGELLDMKKSDLKALPGIGPKRLNEIIGLVAIQGD